MNQSVNASLNRVFQRTFKGQAAVLAGACADLEEQARRLLMMVNGFTPLQVLAGLLPLKVESACALMQRLQDQGLVQEADAGRPPARARLAMRAAKPA